MKCFFAGCFAFLLAGPASAQIVFKYAPFKNIVSKAKEGWVAYITGPTKTGPMADIEADVNLASPYEGYPVFYSYYGRTVHVTVPYVSDSYMETVASAMKGLLPDFTEEKAEKGQRYQYVGVDAKCVVTLRKSAPKSGKEWMILEFDSFAPDDKTVLEPPAKPKITRWDK